MSDIVHSRKIYFTDPPRKEPLKRSLDRQRWPLQRKEYDSMDHLSVTFSETDVISVTPPVLMQPFMPPVTSREEAPLSHVF